MTLHNKVCIKMGINIGNGNLFTYFIMHLSFKVLHVYFYLKDFNLPKFMCNFDLRYKYVIRMVLCVIFLLFAASFITK